MGFPQSPGIDPLTRPVSAAETVRWWWIRHAPVVDVGAPADHIHGDADLPANCDEPAVFASLARYLPAPSVWFASGLQRTQQTAEAIQAFRAGREPLEKHNGLNEMHFGRWQGRTWTEIYNSAERASVEAFWRDPASQHAPEGDCFNDIVSRVCDVVADGNRRFTGRDIVAVAHAGSIRAALMMALNIDIQSVFRISIDCLSVTRMDQCDGHWQVKSINAPVTPWNDRP